MSAPLVEVRHLTKHFARGGGLFRQGSIVKANHWTLSALLERLAAEGGRFAAYPRAV